MAELVADRAHVAHTSLVDWIGRTPLVRLRRFETREGVEIYAKLEMKNPGGSVKDRAALAMMLEGERTGALGRRPHPPRRHVRQHRHRLRDARRRARPPRSALRPVERHARAQAPASGLWRRPRAHRSDGRQRRRHPPGARDLRARARTLLLPGPVQQPGELARALRHDRRRDPRADRRPDHALRRGARHERHVRRHGPSSAAGQAGRHARSPCSRTRRCTASKGSSTWQSAIVPAIYDPSLADVDAAGVHRSVARR